MRALRILVMFTLAVFFTTLSFAHSPTIDHHALFKHKIAWNKVADVNFDVVNVIPAKDNQEFQAPLSREGVASNASDIPLPTVTSNTVERSFAMLPDLPKMYIGRRQWHDVIIDNYRSPLLDERLRIRTVIRTSVLRC